MKTLITLCVFSLVLSSATSLQAAYVTVSLAPVANDVHERILGIPTGMQVLGGVPFDLLPATENNSWAASTGTTVGVQSVQTMVLPVNIYGATAVDTLINLGWGVDGSTSVSMLFLGTGGASYSISLIGGVDIRDWYQGAYANTINGTTTMEVFQGLNNPALSGIANANGIGRIDKQTIALPSSFASQTLTTIILIDAGVTGSGSISYSQSVGAQRALVYGVTVTTAVPEPATATLLLVGLASFGRRVRRKPCVPTISAD